MSRDGVAYETQRWVIDADCVYEPNATAYRQVNRSNATLPSAVLGVTGAVTDVALRDWLMQPRGQLTYAVGGTLLLSTPAPGYDRDALNGPAVERCVVREILGSRAFTVSIRIVAHVNEGPQTQVVYGFPTQKATGFRVLLSNRWRRYVIQDDQYFVVVITEGLAKLRGDELARRGQVADNYRGAVLPPVPRNFSRVAETVVPSEDNSELQYRTEDRELAFNTPASFGATRLEVYESRSVMQPDAIGGIAAGLTTTFPTAVNFINSLTLRGVGTTRDSRDRMARGLGTAFNTAVSIARQVFPVLVSTGSAKAWGHRGSFRSNLAGLAVGACVACVGNVGPERTTQATMVQERSGKYVEYSISHTFVMTPARAQPIVASDGTNIADLIDFADRVGRNENIPNLNQGAADNLSPPNSNGTRGSWPGQLTPAPAPTPHATPPGYPDVNAPNLDASPP